MKQAALRKWRNDTLAKAYRGEGALPAAVYKDILKTHSRRVGYNDKGPGTLRYQFEQQQRAEGARTMARLYAVLDSPKTMMNDAQRDAFEAFVRSTGPDYGQGGPNRGR
jgi:hypothetical protein